MTTLDLINSAVSSGHSIEYLNTKSTLSFCVEDEDGCHIVLSTKLHGTAEKEHLGHEVGHAEHGGTYNRYSPFEIRERAERRAEKWAFYKLLPPGDVLAACREGARYAYQIAERFDVSCEYAYKAMSYYRSIGLI